MSEKFQNKNRSESARLQAWNYGNNGAYFITICTQDRKYFFGDVSSGEMILNEPGKMAEQFWNEIPNHFPYVELGNFVVMPNHVHGVLIINKPYVALPLPFSYSVGTRLIASLPNTKTVTDNRGGITGDKNPMLQENISRVIRWYKGRCSFEIRKNHPGFGWQSRFYDHIIRNGTSFKRIQNYILNNPRNWLKDKMHAESGRDAIVRIR